MKIFADLDRSNRAVSIKMVNDDYVDTPTSVPITFFDDDIIGRTYKGNGEFYPRLNILTNKAQIMADGVDTATITVNVQDTVNPHQISFSVNNGTPVVVNTVNGIATLPVTTTVPGDYIVTATSDLYGTNSVTIKGV